MKSQHFFINDKFRIASIGHDPKEIFTVQKVGDDYIVCTSDKHRWQGTDCIKTDTNLEAVTIEMVESGLKKTYEHYAAMEAEARAA